MTDYVPEILPWNDKHRPETEEEKKEFEDMMEEKQKEIQAIIQVPNGFIVVFSHLAIRYQLFCSLIEKN